jgi:hypothetical protein
MKSYKLDKKYFKGGKKDVVTLGIKNTFVVEAGSNLSQKVLEKLYNLDKPYIVCDCDEPCEKKKSKVKSKKVKIDESKSAKEELQEEVSESSEEE